MSKFLLHLSLIQLFFIVFCQLSVAKLHAITEDFDISLVTHYYISQSADTQVRQEVILTNRSSAVYATDYAFAVNAEISGIRSEWEDGESLPFITSQSESGTIVTVNFDQSVVGKDQALSFILEYNQPDVAHLSGRVLEVNIPQLTQQSVTDSYQIYLHVPESFGQPAQLRPSPEVVISQDNNRVYTFTNSKEELLGINGIFGESQVMQFSLNYHLENPTINNGITQITIPPDTSYQRVYYENIQPPPESVKADADGNWLATYLLKPKEKVSVIVQGKAELFLDPVVNVPGYTKSLETYLQPHKYWPIHDQEIQTRSEAFSSAEEIYQYLVENFTYNYNKLDNSSERLGGKQALIDQSNAICQEFTDAFITLARASGIPARAHNGYAYTQNSRLRPLSLVKDVLHAWPDYYDYDRQQWISIDPTWGNTTGGVNYFDSFDLNHFTFVIHGTDSEKPYPAGYYKSAESTEKDVLVEFTQEKPSQTKNFKVVLEPNFLSLLGLPGWGRLTVHNQSNTAYYNTHINISNIAVQSKSQDNVFQSILPFGSDSHRIWYAFGRPIFNLNFTLPITIDNQIDEVEVKISPLHYVSLVVVSLCLVGGSFLVTIITWRLLVSRRK
jgi:transglutaminase-like putative cysteine protease